MDNLGQSCMQNRFVFMVLFIFGGFCLFVCLGFFFLQHNFYCCVKFFRWGATVWAVGVKFIGAHLAPLSSTDVTMYQAICHAWISRIFFLKQWFSGRIRVWADLPPPPLWQLNHANSAYFGAISANFDTRSTLFANAGSSPGFSMCLISTRMFAACLTLLTRMLRGWYRKLTRRARWKKMDYI